MHLDPNFLNRGAAISASQATQRSPWGLGPAYCRRNGKDSQSTFCHIEYYLETLEPIEINLKALDHLTSPSRITF